MLQTFTVVIASHTTALDSPAEEDELMMRKRVPISASMSKLASMDNVAHVVAPVAELEWLCRMHSRATIRDTRSVAMVILN